MTVNMFLAFWAVSILFVITPGADWAYAISAGLRNKAVVPAVSGLVLGHLVATLMVAAGVGALVASTAFALSVLTVVGSGYLMWLGINMYVCPPVPTGEQEEEPIPWTRWVVNGFGVSGLNPKVFLLFLALLPQFTDASAAWPIPVQIIVLGVVHAASCGAVYLLVGYSAQAVLQTRPQVARIVGRVSGSAMIVIALFLLAEQISWMTSVSLEGEDD